MRTWGHLQVYHYSGYMLEDSSNDLTLGIFVLRESVPLENERVKMGSISLRIPDMQQRLNVTVRSNGAAIGNVCKNFWQKLYFLKTYAQVQKSAEN